MLYTNPAHATVLMQLWVHRVALLLSDFRSVVIRNSAIPCRPGRGQSKLSSGPPGQTKMEVDVDAEVVELVVVAVDADVDVCVEVLLNEEVEVDEVVVVRQLCRRG